MVELSATGLFKARAARISVHDDEGCFADIRVQTATA